MRNGSAAVLTSTSRRSRGDDRQHRRIGVCRARHSGSWSDRLARALALLILATWAGEYLADVIRCTWSTQFTLPLQLTDAVSLAAIVALWTRRPLLVELTYFWAFTASLQAVATPDPGADLP
jgi:uncharacterized membrane protein YwaF